MDAKSFTVGQRVAVTLGSWTGCEGNVTYVGRSPVDRDWCYWVRIDDIGEHLFKRTSIAPLDLLAPADGATLL
jgi:hypothetical protein